ncbi:MAG: hypothetical protein R2823_03955 [Acidimicrobiia bacterium]
MHPVITEVDQLYEGVVTNPRGWTAQSFADWADSVAATGSIDRDSAKHLRRIVRTGERLRDFWIDDGRVADASIGWRSRVDLSFGARAWRPVLDLAMCLLEHEPDPELFETVAGLFRLVHHRPWLDGIEYDEWRLQAGRN